MVEDIELKKISVIIPMYNAAKTIERSLLSVIDQTYQGVLEIIVVNDGSKDESRKLVENFILRYPDFNIKLINQKNGGVSKARNVGLKNSTGDLIALLDSDDEWDNKKLSKQLPFIMDGVADFVTSLRNTDKLGFPYKLINQSYATVSLKQLLFKVVGQTSTALFKRSIIEEHGVFDEDQRYSEDAQFWMRVANSSKMIIINEVLVITGGGKPSVGFSGLSANVEEMEKGVQKNINDMYKFSYINCFEFLFFKFFSKLKYLVRKMRYR